MPLSRGKHHGERHPCIIMAEFMSAVAFLKSPKQPFKFDLNISWWSEPPQMYMFDVDKHVIRTISLSSGHHRVSV